MGDEVLVAKLPPCDVCRNGTPALYDSRLPGLGGSWGYVCHPHWKQYGPGQLGTGHGQRLMLDDGPPQVQRPDGPLEHGRYGNRQE